MRGHLWRQHHVYSLFGVRLSGLSSVQPMLYLQDRGKFLHFSAFFFFLK
jgi:hypothetical protein